MGLWRGYSRLLFVSGLVLVFCVARGREGVCWARGVGVGVCPEVGVWLLWSPEWLARLPDTVIGRYSPACQAVLYRLRVEARLRLFARSARTLLYQWGEPRLLVPLCGLPALGGTELAFSDTLWGLLNDACLLESRYLQLPVCVEDWTRRMGGRGRAWRLALAELVVPGMGSFLSGRPREGVSDLMHVLTFGGVALEGWLRARMWSAYFFLPFTAWIHLSNVVGVWHRVRAEAMVQAIDTCLEALTPYLQRGLDEDTFARAGMLPDTVQLACACIWQVGDSGKSSLDELAWWGEVLRQPVLGTPEVYRRIARRLYAFYRRCPCGAVRLWQVLRTRMPPELVCLTDDTACLMLLHTALAIELGMGEYSRGFLWLSLLEERGLVVPGSELCRTGILLRARLNRWEDAYQRCLGCMGDTTFCQQLFFHVKEKRNGQVRMRPRWYDFQRVRRWALWVPGGGHFYAGYPVEGLWSGLLQVGTVGGVVFLVYQRLYFTAVAVGGSLFHAFRRGSVSRAQRLVERRNGQLLQKIAGQLRSYPGGVGDGE